VHVREGAREALDELGEGVEPVRRERVVLDVLGPAEQAHRQPGFFSLNATV
jgi:hypothetical protein